MIKRSHIRQFLAVVDAGSFTQAAQHIRVTQPALSIGVAELERQVGAPLFIRSRRQIRLTEAGGRFLLIARDLERGFRAADGFGRQTETMVPLLRTGVTRAALWIGVAEPGRQVGAPLFRRSRRQIRVTEAGGRFLLIARDLERGFRAADGFGRQTETMVRLLRIGVIRSAPGEFLQRLVAEFARSFSIEIVEGSDAELRAALAGGRIQAALVPLRAGEGGAQSAMALYEEPLVMLVSDSHALAGRSEEHTSELKSLMRISYAVF